MSLIKEKDRIVSANRRPGSAKLNDQISLSNAYLKKLEDKPQTCPFKAAVLNSFSDNRAFSETFHNKSVKVSFCFFVA